MKAISIIIPVFNERENLQELYDRLIALVRSIGLSYQFIFINDGSTDDSLIKLKDLSEKDSHVFFIDLSRNFGHQIAVSVGLDHSNAEATVIIDADLQDPPEVIAELYQKYREGFDVVYAQRLSREGEDFLKRWTAKIFYRLLRKIAGVDIPIDTGDFRIMSRKVVDALKSMPEQNKFIRGQIAWLGFRQEKITYERRGRKHGSSSYSYSKMFNLALDAVTSFSDKPLTYVSRIGFLISLFSLAVICYALFAHFILKHTITGWTSLIISVMFVGGIQLFSIGIIGEYLSRIHKNVKQRPLYIISETNLEVKGHKLESESNEL